MKRQLHYTVSEEDGVFVAHCAEIDIASEGDTEQEALANLYEAVELYFAEEETSPVNMIEYNFSTIQT